ncbi:hypothetical protein [Streptomyces sp. DSM 40750]|uniref:hypothetical protein n=1 Tax=Streptomyces sp. DSM 40750 TaxID=2801030 RepID=UPI00214BFEDA|nr:hypothetical protein [Streptomyces sp. DSM 40750]UUU21715.1 hypothetical protein JIX55_16035 [Streptomyces sp. DSM 40750]
MPIYERFSGGQVSARVRPVPGSEAADEYAALAADPSSGWRCSEPAQEPEPVVPERPAKSAVKGDWVAYAQAVDPDTGGLDELTKDQLIELYGEGDEA